MRAMIGLLGASLIASAAVAAPTAQQKCQGGMQEAAAKYALCRAKADKKLIISGDGAKHTESIAKCDAKLTALWAKLEAKAVAAGTTCANTTAATAIEGFVSACTDAVGTAVAGGTLPSDVDTCDQGWTTCGNDLSSCQDDLAVAQACGNGIVDAGEDCDIGTLFEATCISEGFAGGTLACAGGCAFNTAGCYSSRFSDNADGTITDNETGLMWEKKIRLDSGVDVANLEDADNYYLWSGICSDESRCQPDAASEAACLAGAEGSTNGCARCATGTCNVTPNGTVWQWLVSLNTSGYGGHSDWRLPTKSELSALIDDGQPTSPRIAAAFHGASCGAACADVTDPACSCTRSDLYWSASSASPNTDTAWMVLFDIGDVDTVNKFFTSYVRAVRGGAQ